MKLTKHKVVYVTTGKKITSQATCYTVDNYEELAVVVKENVFVLTESEIAQLMLLFSSQELPFDEFINQNIEL